MLCFARFIGFRKWDSTLHPRLILLFLFFAFWLSQLCARSPVQVFPDSDGRSHNCVHSLTDMHRIGHSWVSYSDFSLYLSWDGFIMPFHDVHLFCGALKITVCHTCFRRSRIVCPCTYVAQSACLCTLIGLYTVLKSVWGHAEGISSLIPSAHCSDGLHCFSWDFQHGPARGWMARRILLPFYLL